MIPNAVVIALLVTSIAAGCDKTPGLGGSDRGGAGIGTPDGTATALGSSGPSSSGTSDPSSSFSLRSDSSGPVAPGGAAGALRYCPPGDLLGPGESGNASRQVFFPDIRFPIEFSAATHMVSANSQMYNPGGYCSSGVCNGSDGGSSCVISNFTQPWRDTFCEEAGRTYGTAMCPDGRGHQGLDIRPPVRILGEDNVCKRDHWFALAAADGQVIRASGAVVEIVDRSGRRYVYRHMNPASIRSLGISRGRVVSAGQRVGRIDQFNNPGTERYTTLHLHLEGLAQAPSGERIYYPLYTSIIAAYRRSVGLPSLINQTQQLGVESRRELTGGCG